MIIPTTLQAPMLQELHSAHAGMVKMKAIARSIMWWPQMDQEIPYSGFYLRGPNLCELCETLWAREWKICADITAGLKNCMFAEIAPHRKNPLYGRRSC